MCRQPPCFDSPKFGPPARSRRPARLIFGRIFPPIVSVSGLVRINGQSPGPEVQAAKGEAVADGAMRGSRCTENVQEHKCSLLNSSISFKREIIQSSMTGWLSTGPNPSIRTVDLHACRFHEDVTPAQKGATQ